MRTIPYTMGLGGEWKAFMTWIGRGWLAWEFGYKKAGLFEVLCLAKSWLGWFFRVTYLVAMLSFAISPSPAD